MSNEVLWLGGLLNFTDPVFHLQAYIWLWLFLLVITGVCYAAWYYGKWMPFKALHGLYYAYKSKTFAAFIFNSELIAELVSEREAKCIFDYSKWEYEGLSRFKALLFNYATVFLPEITWAQAIMYKFGKVNLDVEIAKKMQDYEWERASSVTVGGIHTDMILDADRWTVPESPQHRIVEETADKWNDANKNDEVHSYSKFQRYLLEGKIPCPKGIRPTITVPWIRIDSAFPLELEDNEMAGARRQKAEEDAEVEKNVVAKFYIPLLVGSFLLAGIIFTFRFLSKMMAK